MRCLTFVFAFCFSGLFAFSQPISPNFFGQNAWMPSWYYNGNLDNIWQKAKPANFEIIRIGGIEYEENFDNHINDYLRFIDSIRVTCGAEPILQILRTYTVQQVQDLYELVNVTRNNNVRYWCIGNEPDSHKPNTPGEIVNYFIRIAKALKDKDNSLIVIGPDYANYWVHPGDQYDSGKTTYSTFINAVGMEMNTAKTAYLLDVFCFHNYIGYTVDPLIDNQDLERVVDNTKITLNAINKKRIAGIANKASWAIGEINIANDGSARRTPWSFYAGQYFAMIYGVGMKKEASFICPWSLTEGEWRKATDMSMFENKAKNFAPRSTFQHLKMLTDNRKANYMKSTSSSGFLKSVGMKDASGSTLMIMNTDEKLAYKTTIKLDLANISPTEFEVKADAGLAIELVEAIPANATITMVFDESGKLLKRITYTKADADSYREPSITTGLFNQIEFSPDDNLIVYPTLTNGLLMIKQSSDRMINSIHVYDISGKEYSVMRINKNQLDISSLKNGFYLLKIETEKDIQQMLRNVA